jgi:hypothetical protein
MRSEESAAYSPMTGILTPLFKVVIGTGAAMILRGSNFLLARKLNHVLNRTRVTCNDRGLCQGPGACLARRSCLSLPLALSVRMPLFL